MPENWPPRRVRRLPPPKLGDLLRRGFRPAGRAMLGRRGGQISALRQRALGWPNLQKAWQRRRELQERKEAEKTLEERRRELAPYYESRQYVVVK